MFRRVSNFLRTLVFQIHVMDRLFPKLADVLFGSPLSENSARQEPEPPYDYVARLHPVEFSEKCDVNIIFRDSRTIAIRSTSSVYATKGIVTVREPLQLNSIFAVQILGKDDCYVGSLNVGIRDNSSDDGHVLEVARDAAPGLEVGDTLILEAVERLHSRKHKSSHGTLELRTKDKSLFCVKYDPDRDYRLFFDISGSTTQIKAFSHVIPLIPGDSFKIQGSTGDSESKLRDANRKISTLKLRINIWTHDIDHYSNISEEATPGPAETSEATPEPAKTSESPIPAPEETSQSETTAEATPGPAKTSESPIPAPEETSQSETTADDDQPKFEVIKELPECKVCMDELVNAVLIPCAHMCLCKKCAIEIMSNIDNGANESCPICRCIIEKVLKVYL